MDSSLPPLPGKLTPLPPGIKAKLRKNGKAPKRPRRKPGEVQRQASINMKPSDWAAFKAEAQAKGVSAAAALGKIIAAPEIKREALSLSARKKLDVAMRQARQALEAELRAEWQIRIEAHIARLKAEAVPRWQEDARRAAHDRAFYHRLINDRKALFSDAEFKLILSCLHPDGERTQERKQEAFRLFIDKKLQLTKVP
jgi:hypothetical protein